MASVDNKLPFVSDDEKSGSPTASAYEPAVEAGHVSFLKRRFPGFSLAVRQEESSFAATKRASNADFDPIPPSKRTWNWGAYVAYWMADAWAVSNWEVGESRVPQRRACSTQSESAAVLTLGSRSFFDDRGRAQLENGHRCLCPG
jgi:NCS1 family nucleobase:cation symporter-1